MKNLTLQNITNAVGGVYHGDAALLSREISAVTTDSRKIEPDSLFVAIKGARSDGHDYIPGAYEKGALCCISEKQLPGEAHSYIQVASSMDAIQKLAAFYRNALDIKVIGITGSVGKTSTKEMVASVLSEKYTVLKTLGNFNNGLGLPLTIFRLRESDEIAVLEMGISEFGEMRVLTNIARPDIVVMTNIGQCHLETLKTRDGILQAKSEIFECISPDGMIFLNGDDDKLSTIKEKNGIKPFFFGLDPARDAFADNITDNGLEGTSCDLHFGDDTIPVTIHIPGQHMLYNALAGASVGRALGLTDAQIQAGIDALKPVSGRNNILRCRNMTVIDDCYNANPASMKASIDVISAAKSRKVCVLGDMFELGEKEVQLHREVGSYLAEKPVDVLLTAGRLAKELADAASVKANLQVTSYPDTDTLLAALPTQLQAGDTVLVKASHGMEFSKLIAWFTS